MQLAGLGAVTLVDKYGNASFGREISGQRSQQILYIFIIILFGCFAAALAEFMYQRANQPILRFIQPLDQIVAALGTDDLFPNADKQLFDLIIQLFPVSDDQDTCFWIVGKDPLGQPHHRQGLTAALRMPDNAALLFSGEAVLSTLDGVILIIAADLFPTLVEDNEVMDQVEKAVFLEHSIELPVQLFIQRGTHIRDIQIVE